MRKTRVLLAFLVLLAAIVLGAAALTGSPAEARPRPQPDCGPTFEWTCTMPDESQQIVAGTRCEIAAFQKQTGAHCAL